MSFGITKHTAADVTIDELAAAMNAVYQGYVMPVQVDGGWMANHVASNDVRLDASPVWRDGENTVGLALVGIRGERSWLGGFGITPEWRGKHLAGPLLDATLAAAAAAGARRMQLEVITTNSPAIRVYERGGFSVTRELGVYQRAAAGETGELPADVALVDPAAILTNRERLGGRPLAWQRESGMRALTAGVEALASPPDDPRAYVVWQPGPRAAQIVDVGGTDAGSIVAVLEATPSACAGQPMALLNEPLDNPVTEALLAAGWHETVRQLEMERTLPA